MTMTVNRLRALLRPLYGLCLVEVEIMPCPPYPRELGRPRKDMAQIIGTRRVSRTGIIVIEVARQHDC